MVDLAERFKEVAEANFFQVTFAETLRAHPMGLHDRVLLEVEPLAGDTENFKLLQHRQPKWTVLYAGKTVSATWIEKFLQENRGVAWFIAEAQAIENRAKAGTKSNTEYGKICTDELAAQRRRVEETLSAEEKLKREKSIREANARITAANVAAGLDGVDSRSRTVAYYDAFLRNNGGGPYARGRGGPTRK
jgi:hypothetical protein